MSLLIIAAAMLLILHVVIAAERTHKEREDLHTLCGDYARRAIKGGDMQDALTIFEEFESVHQRSHLWYRLTFRNPQRLYGRRVRDLANNLNHVIQIKHD